MVNIIQRIKSQLALERSRRQPSLKESLQQTKKNLPTLLNRASLLSPLMATGASGTVRATSFLGQTKSAAAQTFGRGIINAAGRAVLVPAAYTSGHLIAQGISNQPFKLPSGRELGALSVGGAIGTKTSVAIGTGVGVAISGYDYFTKTIPKNKQIKDFQDFATKGFYATEQPNQFIPSNVFVTPTTLDKFKNWLGSDYERDKPIVAVGENPLGSVGNISASYSPAYTGSLGYAQDISPTILAILGLVSAGYLFGKRKKKKKRKSKKRKRR